MKNLTGFQRKRGQTMNKYHDIEVIINNKRYTLSGYESEEYLHKIASYINNKHNEFRNKDAYKFLILSQRIYLFKLISRMIIIN